MKPCPFCGVYPVVLLDAEAEDRLYEHPDNDCILAMYVFHENFADHWNRRMELEDGTSTG